MEIYYPGSFISILFFVSVVLIFMININVAISLFRYAKAYNTEHGRYLFFVHPLLLIPCSLLFGVLLGVVASFLAAIEKR